ncbi:MAG TPA: hypothetical protein PLJ98_08830 [Acholeplasmataceae bacterium]|jgi:hypothetical protein|nr:hypothetical protein [Acholeplasmataceae bacterium]HRX45382.1 hypothetical protein [Acholeplasmataceae bacterium]
MEKQVNLATWIRKFNDGDFDSRDVQTQIEAGWFDWFCKDTSLANKTKRLGNIIKQIKAGGKVDLETSYVWFKNNCPLNGPLFDDFRIADIETNNNLFVVQIDCLWNDSKYTVYERLDGFDKPAFKTNSSRELVKWFNVGWN